MGNSTIRLQDALDYCQTLADLQAVIPAAGYSAKKVFFCANAVMKKFLSSALKWNFNRKVLPIGITNSWQQDYPTNLVDVAYIQDGYLLEINNTSKPRPIWPLEAVQNMPETTHQYGRPGQICTLLNKDLQYSTWGATGIGTGGIQNPQPNQTIVNPVGASIAPANPVLSVRDPNGNLWIMTKIGTTGNYGQTLGINNQPPWPATPIFPSFQSPTTVPTTLTDGTCVWTAVNPFNWGFRLGPLPPQTGVPYQIYPIYQMRPPTFTTLGQFLDPIPDDFAPAFMDGMVAHFYAQVTDPKIRAKHSDSITLWEKSLRESKSSQDRTRDSAMMYPAQSIMQGGDTYWPNSAQPIGPAF